MKRRENEKKPVMAQFCKNMDLLIAVADKLSKVDGQFERPLLMSHEKNLNGKTRFSVYLKLFRIVSPA